MQHNARRRVAVVGCGIFGATVALRLAAAGWRVVVFERAATALSGATANNLGRVHLGFHYPRDRETARQCAQGFSRFCWDFADAIDLVPTYYFVAKAGSLVTAEEYLYFAQGLGVRSHHAVDADLFDVREVAPVGISAEEAVYDFDALRTIILDRFRRAGVALHLRAQVRGVERDRGGFHLSTDSYLSRFDAVVNCTYADVNRLGHALGHTPREYQYEYTAVSIVEWDREPVGITIMDGPFATILPMGRTGKFLLYHVEHSVIAREVGTQLPWTAAPTVDDVFHKRLRDACAHFVPAIATSRPVGLLQGPRVTLAHADATDARPSIVSVPEPGYVTVLSSKVDHAPWVADDVVQALS